MDAWKAALAANPMEMLYALATPVTIDLGHIDPALLPAPDLTAYVVPSAPSVLRYGFDVAAALAEIRMRATRMHPRSILSPLQSFVSRPQRVKRV